MFSHLFGLRCICCHFVPPRAIIECLSENCKIWNTIVDWYNRSIYGEKKAKTEILCEFVQHFSLVLYLRNGFFRLWLCDEWIRDRSFQIKISGFAWHEACGPYAATESESSVEKVVIITSEEIMCHCAMFAMRAPHTRVASALISRCVCALCRFCAHSIHLFSSLRWCAAKMPTDHALRTNRFEVSPFGSWKRFTFLWIDSILQKKRVMARRFGVPKLMIPIEIWVHCFHASDPTRHKKSLTGGHLLINSNFLCSQLWSLNKLICRFGKMESTSITRRRSLAEISNAKPTNTISPQRWNSRRWQTSRNKNQSRKLVRSV